MRKAIPKDLKCACSPRPWQGYSSSHSERRVEGEIGIYLRISRGLWFTGLFNVCSDVATEFKCLDINQVLINSFLYVLSLNIQNIASDKTLAK